MMLIILLITLNRVSAVIYELNKTEYARMPPVFHLDPYELCVGQPGGLYCMVDIKVVGDNDNDLFQMMQEYSERTETHFNHTRLQYGICVTKMCNNNLKLNTTSNDSKLVVEQCLNTSFWEQYKLKTRINGDMVCNNENQNYPIEPLDTTVAVICLCILFLNVAGSVYHILIVKKNEPGNKWLLCFSIKHNWTKLTEIKEDQNRKQNGIDHLKGLNGLKVITTILVIIFHSLMTFLSELDNTQYIELAYSYKAYHLGFDGTLFVQTFFLVSGCLASYNFRRKSQENKMIWTRIFKRILLRWLRLTPPYAVWLAFSATWLRFVGSGPLWQKNMGAEVADCRRYGWQNMLYIHNYFDNSRCMMHTWYVAADMQLFILGTLILVLMRNDVKRQIALWTMFVISLFIVPLVTYFKNLYTHVIFSPEVYHEYFIKDPTLNLSYKRGHTNITCYILGLILGLLIYKLQEKQINVEKYKNYKYMFWATFPLMLVLIICRGLLYMDGVRPDVIVRAISAGIYRSLYGLLLFLFILGMVFKIESVYRPVLEWRGWTTIVRITYSVYIVHLTLILIVDYSRTTLNHVSLLNGFMAAYGSIAISFTAAVPLWLLVESPISQLVKNVTSRRKNRKQMKRTGSEEHFTATQVC